MTIQDIYDVEIKLFNLTDELDANLISFVAKDSIWSILPELEFTYNDISGIYQDKLAFYEGVPIDLSFGVSNTIDRVSNKYVIADDSVNEIQSQNTLGGKVTCNCVHEAYDKQEMKNTGYKSNISDIVNRLVAPYQFKMLNIDTTLSDDLWYQIGKSDLQFINDVLLENAYSVSGNDTPFFCFVTSKNEFNFITFDSMLNKNAPIELTYDLTDLRQMDNTYIQSIVSRQTLGSFQTKKNRKILSYAKSLVDGSYTETILDMTKFPMTPNKTFPVYSFNIENQSYTILGDDDPKLKNIKARQIYTQKKSMILERMLIVLPLNLNIFAGKTVNLTIKDPDEPTANSLTMSGKWVVEQSNHVWEGDKASAYTQLVIGRRTLTAPNTLLQKPKLMTG